MSQTTIQTIGLTDSSVTSIKIASGAVETIKIADDAVTIDKINFGYALVPIGGIIMWSGTIANIPQPGWALCNGQEVNGKKTPNLTDKFIVGAGSGLGNGTVETAGPGFNVDNGTLNSNYTPGNFGGSVGIGLTIGEMPSHNHTNTLNLENPNGFGITQAAAAGQRVHGIISNGTTFLNPAGEDKFHENRPPYYALAFIMRIS